jgi:hypothetical protein
MGLATAQIVVLDSSTLGNVSRDYWSPEERARAKARSFISDLTDRGACLAFTISHLGELLRHDNPMVVDDRLRFLRKLPLVAWLRPYDRNWFPGCVVDLFARELDAFRNGSSPSWRTIRDEVREDLWETGHGAEIFIESDLFWDAIREVCKQQEETERLVASVARTNMGDISKMTMDESRKLGKRPREEWPDYGREFAAEMHRRLVMHGDPRLASKDQIAFEFTENTFERISSISLLETDPVEALLKLFGVPMELIEPATTVEEVGELGIFVKQLQIITKHLRPIANLTVLNVPIAALPAYVFERRLRALQKRADKVSGSDVGDGHIASLVLYADFVQVDKRTHNYLEQLKRSLPGLGELMCRFFKVGDYPEILDRLT